jgi:ubiquinone/menaquinone biosynthesis C-methylase UbiE
MSTPLESNTERFKEQMRQDWSTVAPGWGKGKAQREVQSHAATEIIIQAVRLKPGMRVLDLASGTGYPALTLAEVVGPDGHVTATDLAPEMLLVAEESARERGLTNISFQQADAEALPFPDQSFDAVTCRFGVMFFPNVQQALQEIRRVLKVGARTALVAWGPVEQNPDHRIPQEILRKYEQIPRPEPGGPNAFKFAQAGVLSTTLREAALRGCRKDTAPSRGPGLGRWSNAGSI